MAVQSRSVNPPRNFRLPSGGLTGSWRLNRYYGKRSSRIIRHSPDNPPHPSLSFLGLRTVDHLFRFMSYWKTFKNTGKELVSHSPFTSPHRSDFLCCVVAISLAWVNTFCFLNARTSWTIISIRKSKDSPAICLTPSG